MEKDHVGEGFPNVEGFYVDSVITLSRPGELMLLFYRASDDGKFIRQTRVTLIGSQMIEANFEMRKFYSPNVISFPEMTSYHIRDAPTGSTQRRILTFNFANGSLSYAFEKAFYLTTVRPLGPLHKFVDGNENEG
jgi:hypothetical protein